MTQLPATPTREPTQQEATVASMRYELSAFVEDMWISGAEKKRLKDVFTTRVFSLQELQQRLHVLQAQHQRNYEMFAHMAADFCDCQAPDGVVTAHERRDFVRHHTKFLRQDVKAKHGLSVPTATCKEALEKALKKSAKR